MKKFLILFMTMTLPAWAGSFEDVARPCMIERLDRARAACLGVLADQWIAKAEGRIAVATIDLQAASASELATFQQNLAVSQYRWRDSMESACRSDDPVEFQKCRLASAIQRDQVVRETLAEARAEMGVAPVFEVPEQVEVLIPLPGVPAGPDADLRVPLVVPIQP